MCGSLTTISENVMELSACRRNNKMEKRKRNRDYARKFKTVSVSDLLQDVTDSVLLSAVNNSLSLLQLGRWKQKRRCY
jgi:hypothetical protein